MKFFSAKTEPYLKIDFENLKFKDEKLNLKLLRKVYIWTN